ncbi:hypothetical protein IGI04_036441 [Brassica rapa subsp. trilocularis]|uniref:Uncharacterized protein n=1 Tax=Brassica rapa subsp. trilocularis TaxID=1813537 RepID=A0ABQ7LGR3_BRACM|nr:hypothetical protein IGI04_036441 [Brassica rapa subsp. trilocularis]
MLECLKQEYNDCQCSNSRGWTEKKVEAEYKPVEFQTKIGAELEKQKNSVIVKKETELVDQKADHMIQELEKQKSVTEVEYQEDQNEVKEGNKKVNVPELHNQNKVETEKPKVGMRYVDVVKGIGP